MVHRRIAGEFPIYLKFALKVTHPFRKRRFRRISLNSAAAVKASEKSSIIANRKSTMRFPSNHRWTRCVISKPPKGGSKREFFTFVVVFHFIVDISNLICGLNIAVPAYGWQIVPERGWSLSRDLFNFWKLSDNISKTVRYSLIVSTKFE